jgi:hypothetical protein
MSYPDPASDHPVSDEPVPGALRVALADLAATMPEDPFRVDSIPMPRRAASAPGAGRDG